MHRNKTSSLARTATPTVARTRHATFSPSPASS
jgi:hypothetical protein